MFDIDWYSIPIIGPLLEFLTDAASSLADGLAALWNAKELLLDSVAWFPPAVLALVSTAVGAIVVMKIFGR